MKDLSSTARRLRTSFVGAGQIVAFLTSNPSPEHDFISEAGSPIVEAEMGHRQIAGGD
jgi:hypothetical protein